MIQLRGRLNEIEKSCRDWIELTNGFKEEESSFNEREKISISAEIKFLFNLKSRSRSAFPSTDCDESARR